MVFNDYLYIGEYNDEEIALERVLFSKTGKTPTASLAAAWIAGSSTPTWTSP